MKTIKTWSEKNGVTKGSTIRFKAQGVTTTGTVKDFWQGYPLVNGFKNYPLFCVYPNEFIAVKE